MPQKPLPTLVLITPARNEEASLEQTIQAVVHQTVRPIKWVIVNDGSTDRTEEIIRKHAAQHDWIELVQRPPRTERHFAGKVAAFNAGFERVKDLVYDVVGSLDADITFDPEYFEFLMGKFAANPRLGVGGTPFREGNAQYDYRFTSIEHVSGACQLFRKACFAEIGGYVPIKGGGIDLVAVTTARMKGWQTQTFPEMVSVHHRLMGTATQSKLRFYLRGGGRDYALGVHPVWETVRSVYQMAKRPFVLGGCSLLVGYFWAWLTRREKSVSPELVQFRRAEQMTRLKQFARQRLPLPRAKVGRPAA